MTILYLDDSEWVWAITGPKDGYCILVWGRSGWNLHSRSVWCGYSKLVARKRINERIADKVQIGYHEVEPNQSEYTQLREQVQRHLTWHTLTH